MSDPQNKQLFSRQAVCDLCRSVDQPAPVGFADKVLAKAREREQTKQRERMQQREQGRER